MLILCINSDHLKFDVSVMSIQRLGVATGSPGINRRLGEAIEKCRLSFSGMSKSELSSGTTAFKNIHRWFDERLRRLRIQPTDNIVCAPEVPLEIDGLVLKCASFDVRRPLNGTEPKSMADRTKGVVSSLLNSLLAEATEEAMDRSLLLPGEEVPPAIYSAESVISEISDAAIAVGKGRIAIVTAMSPDLYIDGGDGEIVNPLVPGQRIEVQGPGAIRLRINDLVAGIFTCEFVKSR